jgi:hypothetical protein
MYETSARGVKPMALNNPTPAEIAAGSVAYDKAMNPFYHRKRFEIQVHEGDNRRNLYFPTWELVKLVLGTSLVKADDPKRPDRIIVSDNRDTCIRVLEWEKSWYGYETRVRRGAAVGVEPRGWA